VKKALIIISCLFLLAVGFWSIVLPEQFVINLIENSFDSERLYLKPEGFKKGFLYSFRAEKIVLMKRGDSQEKEPRTQGYSVSETPVLTFDHLRGRINLLSLLRLSPRLDFDCTVSGGPVRGDVALTGTGRTRIDGTDIQLQGIPLFEQIGVHGDGNLSVTFTQGSGKGEIRFSLNNARLKATSFGGIFVPLDLFHMVKGALVLNGGTLSTQSFGIYGSGVYARLAGNITDGDLNMKLELMMDSTFTSAPAFQSLLEQYKVSPGYYVIPVKTRVAL